jgi:glycosyltransferase involved in cell wall biosynthesis
MGPRRVACEQESEQPALVMRISVVIPTRNEAGSIARVLDDVPRPPVTDVVVVDAQSTDGTQAIAEAHGARVVSEPRRGYGRACLTGIERVSPSDIIVFLDGDYSDRPAELPALIDPILAGRADIVIGSRLAGKRAPGALPWHSVAGNRTAALLIRLLYGVRITDLGPFRAARGEVIRALGLRETSYGWAVELIVRGALAGKRIEEVPVSYHPRIGQSKITGTVRGSLGAAWYIFGRIFQYRLHRGLTSASTATDA